MLPVIFQTAIGLGGFQQMINNMVSLGFFQFLFPFLLALAIFYGLLRYALPEQIPNSASGLISLILAFFVMLFASANPSIVFFFQNLSGTALMVGTGILFVVILLGLTGFQLGDLIKKDDNKTAAHTVLLLLVVAIVVVLFFGAGTTFLLPNVWVGTDFWTIIFFIIILAIILWFLGGEKRDSNDKKKVT